MNSTRILKNFLIISSFFIFAPLNCKKIPDEDRPLIQSIRLDKNRMIIKPNPEFADQYLLGDFFVEYSDDDPNFDLKSLDFSVLTMPFVMTVMPIIWASNKTYTISSMDETLAKSLDEIKKVFQFFYPAISWSGALIAKELKHNISNQSSEDRTVMLFSGGVDSTYASFVYHEENQHLFIIKAEKYPPKPKELWEETKKSVGQFATQYGQTFSSARSNWKSFLKNSMLKTICPNIPKMWWGYTTQALGYAGIAAPLAIFKGYKKLVVGATHTKKFPYPWGSHPLIDNKIKFANVSICHTGYEATRMDKLQFIHAHCTDKNLKKPFLRVCHSFGYDSRSNCGMCEKCYRTLAGLIALDADIQEYGFRITEKKACRRIEKFFEHKPKFTNGLTFHWESIQQLMSERLKQKTKATYQKLAFFEWFCDLNFQDYNEQVDQPIKKINWDTLEYV